MAELVDALSSDGSGYAVRVRVSLSAPNTKNTLKYQHIFALKYQVVNEMVNTDTYFCIKI